jgi:hypothetical protein
VVDVPLPLLTPVPVPAPLPKGFVEFRRLGEKRTGSGERGGGEDREEDENGAGRDARRVAIRTEARKEEGEKKRTFLKRFLESKRILSRDGILRIYLGCFVYLKRVLP